MNNNIKYIPDTTEKANETFQAAIGKYIQLKAECKQAEYEMHQAYGNIGEFNSFTPNNWDAYIKFEEEEAELRGTTI